MLNRRAISSTEMRLLGDSRIRLRLAESVLPWRYSMTSSSVSARVSARGALAICARVVAGPG